ncbi:MAG: HAMP domain-containing histidine kinase [Candidatus Thorarchaeota archaeon]|nr:HAMP domain-containing histidine kinase [Candidatus Thorarchaeota archaeon]
MNLEKELAQCNQKISRIEYESQKLLEAASIVLQSEDFVHAAKAVFDIAKDLTGASSGYVALLSEDGLENEVLFLDSGGLPCSVDESLPMPIRGLREVVYRENRPAYENAFMESEWLRYMPEGHVTMRNVLFGPLVIAGRAEGLIGLANKPSDFNEDDARIVMALSNLVAIGLKRAKTETELRDSQQRLSETISELKLYTSLLRHDLSNDLQLIIGEIQLAQLKVAEEPELKESCVKIDSACSRMLRLVQVFNKGDILEDNNLLSLIKYLTDETVSSYQEVNIDLHNHTSKDTIIIRGWSLLPFVFDNLIRNAFQHVSPDVEINIHLNTENENVILDFVDNGHGIDSDIAANLFQKGVSKAGSGFGLYLCRKIIETYQGKIFLLPREVYNKGAAIRIELPFVKSDVSIKLH